MRAAQDGPHTTEAEMIGTWTRQIEIAERIAEAFAATGEARGKVWTAEARGIVRVYVSRELSRGRWQDMGHVEVHPDESISVRMERRQSWAEQVVRDAVGR